MSNENKVSAPDERASFEAWADARKEDSIYLPKFSDGTYIYDDTHAAWAAWQARAALAATPAVVNASETPNSSTIAIPRGWKLVPDDATPEWIENLEALPDWREAVGECIKKFLAAAPAAPQAAPAAVAVPDEREAFGIPQCPFPCGWKNLHTLLVAEGAFLARSLQEDEPITDHQRATVMRVVNYGLEMARAALAATTAANSVELHQIKTGLTTALPEPVAFALEWTFDGEERGIRLYDDERHCRFDAESDGGVCSPLYTEQQVRALLATGGQAQAVKLLAADHSGMKVDYRGLFSQVQRALKRTDPGYAEMLRQLEGHLQELGQRWYAGDTDVVDEILQLYCIEPDARKTVGTSATAAPQAQADARGAESDYQRGYRHGYNRRDAEVQGSLL